MPKEIFQPNSGTYTTISIFKTNLSHDYDKEVAFYDLKDDEKAREELICLANDKKKKKTT